MFYDYYGTPGVRDTVHAAKSGKKSSAIRIARDVSDAHVIHEGSYIIPMPGHNGMAAYTLEIAKILAGYTGSKVLDILTCKPHKPLYEAKKDGETIPLVMNVSSGITDFTGCPVFLIDTVIATGQTMATAISALADAGIFAIPLAYAVDGTKKP